MNNKTRRVILSIFGIFILGFIIALYLPPHGYYHQTPVERLKVEVTKTQMKMLSSFLVTFYREREFPKYIEDLIEHEVFREYLKEKQYDANQILTDTWNEKFVYLHLGVSNSLLISKGADRTLGTLDDIELRISKADGQI